MGLGNRDKKLLSSAGFYIGLSAKINEGGESKLMLVDEAGNVEVTGAARMHLWDLPKGGDARQSIVRQYRKLNNNSPDPAADGQMMMSWKQSDVVGVGLSYYGHRDDIGAPGFRTVFDCDL